MVSEGYVKEFKIHPCMLPGNAWITPDLWKLIRWQDGTRELYDLNKDIQERNNLVDEPQLATKVAEMEEQLQEFLNSL
jgi:hypothetical protein